MTVSELIAQLQQYRPDLPVVVSGYEGGLTEIAPLVVVCGLLTYTENPYGCGYFGLYAAPGDELDDVDDAIPPFDAVVIPR